MVAGKETIRMEAVARREKATEKGGAGTSVVGGGEDQRRERDVIVDSRLTSVLIRSRDY